MMIEMFQQRTLRSDNFEDTPKKFVDTIITKLRQNTTLNGKERRLLVEALETHSVAIFRKRKLDAISDEKPQAEVSHKEVQVNNSPVKKQKLGKNSDARPQIEVSNKKVQVKMTSENAKDSFAQTDPLLVDESATNHEIDNIAKLKVLYNDENSSKEEIELLMTETFLGRRNFIITKCPKVSLIMEQYPTLFCIDQVKSELDRIFYPGKCDEFIKNMHKYSKCIYEYAEGDIRERTNKALERFHTPVQKKYAEVVGSVFALAKMCEECFGFIDLRDYPSDDGEVFPLIDASCYSLKNMFFDDINFHIKVEGHELCEASNFPEAILCLMASFFIFNISYPSKCTRTLTIFEKLYLKANDTTEIDSFTEQLIKMLVLKVG